MDIVKSFVSNTFSRDIRIIGSLEDPLFKASDIADILDISCIYTSISSFEDDDKVLHSTQTLGGKQNVIYLTEKGLYKLLFRSKKDIAVEFQNWACKMIKEIRLNQNSELQRLLQNTEDELKTQSALNLQLQNAHLKHERLIFERGDKVYIIEDVYVDEITGQVKFVYKVGFSANMTNRMQTYSTTRFNTGFKCEFMSSNGRLLESVAQHMLRKYIDPSKKEWFHTSLEIVTKAINLAQLLIEDVMSENTTQDEDAKMLDEASAFLKSRINEKSLDESGQKTYDTTQSSELPAENNTVKEKEEKQPPKILRKDNKANVDAKASVQNFLKDCCIIEDGCIEKSMNITSRFRLWAKRQLVASERTELFAYLSDNFDRSTIWNDEAKTDQVAFKGIRLNDSQIYTPSDPPNELDEFIRDRCIVSPGARAPLHSIFEELMEWKRETGKECSLSNKKEHRKMSTYLYKFFVPVSGAFIYHNSRESGGIYGITLKSNPAIEQAHTSQGLNKRKKVYKIDPSSNEVLHVYGSLTELGKELKADGHYIINKKALYKGFLYKYENEL